MNKKLIMQKQIKFVLRTIEKIAEKKARSLCIGLLYEPQVPKKIAK